MLRRWIFEKKEKKLLYIPKQRVIYLSVYAWKEEKEKDQNFNGVIFSFQRDNSRYWRRPT